MVEQRLQCQAGAAVVERCADSFLTQHQTLEIRKVQVEQPEGVQHVAQVRGQEIRLPGPLALVEPTGADQHVHRAIAQQTGLALGA